MGTISHDAMIIQGGEAEREIVLRIARATHADTPWDEDWTQLVSPVIRSLTNGYEFFFVAPDGSKEWWGTSNAGDEFRDAVAAKLKDDVVHVRWGELGMRISADGHEVERTER